MNTPIQGTAADIMKMAMIRVSDDIKANAYDAKILLQVHDELIVEVREDQANDVADLLVSDMQNICQLNVPLKVNVNTGINWYEAK